MLTSNCKSKTCDRYYSNYNYQMNGLALDVLRRFNATGFSRP